MTDLNIPVAADRALSSAQGAPRAQEPIWEIIELLFFAYRDFIGDPDDVLSKLGFGRAHHRVLHFVNRNPGMKVAELLDILKITKQSLGRVLKQLVDQGYVVQKEGENDRRQRLLYVTPKGETLAMKLAGLQTERIARALAEIGPNAHEAARPFLNAVIDAASRDGTRHHGSRSGRRRLCLKAVRAARTGAAHRQHPQAREARGGAARGIAAVRAVRVSYWPCRTAQGRGRHPPDRPRARDAD